MINLKWTETSKSSNIKRFGYDPDNKCLVVDYKKTGMYIYMEVPLDVYESMCKASSVGAFVYDNIQVGYAYSKYTEPEVKQ